MEATAKHDFTPADPATELAFRRGDKMVILNYGDEVQWYNAEMGGKRGLVPGNYIDIPKPNWYHGRISRMTAEQMLMGNRHEGAFLVRLSESSPTDFSLSVKCNNAVQHFRILKDHDNKYFLWSTKFDSLNQLVEHYRTETVSRSSTIFLTDMESDNQFVVEAIYDFDPSQDKDGEGEMEFKKGELITVFDNSDEHWWGGSIGERSGYFPRLYVQPYKPGSNIHR